MPEQRHRPDRPRGCGVVPRLGLRSDDGVPDPGTVVVLNGTPRSGKTSIASAMQQSSEGLWLNLGVDAFSQITPAQDRPGIGLRPGGERPDLEAHVVVLFEALYGAVTAWSRRGLNVVVDVGHHEDYSTPLGILGRVARDLRGLPAYLIGVRCPAEVVLARRGAGEPGRATPYVTAGPGGGVPDVVLRWDRAVHDPGIYDLEVDTSMASPEECARAIRRRLAGGPPTAFTALAQRS